MVAYLAAEIVSYTARKRASGTTNTLKGKFIKTFFSSLVDSRAVP